MINIDLQRLVRTLDGETRQLLEQAAQRCVARGGQQVLPEDLLLQLLEVPEGLLPRALEDAGVDASELAAVLQPRSENGESRNPVFSRELVQWLQDALLLANLQQGAAVIDQAALLLAMLENPLRYAGSRYQALLSQIDAQRLREYAESLKPEDRPRAAAAAGGESALQQFAHDVTAQAAEGRLDPVLCRDEEIAQMIDILARRRKNNPIVVGEAGVGKTALVEGLALRIAAGEVPEVLRGVRLLCLDLGLLQAGASVKGEFERRLQGVLDEVRASTQPIILFIDEAHTLIGAGGQAGGSDAANLLKPALARGELRTIAATTWSEYKKYFEKDPALARRFQPVRVHEPDVEQAVSILRGLAGHYAGSHGVYLRDDAVRAAAELSARYLAGRQLPDKAVDLLDTACARVRIGLASPPAAVQRRRAEQAELQREVEALRRDLDAGLGDPQRLDLQETRLQALGQELQALEARWQVQRELAEQLLALRSQGAEDDATRAELEALGERLSQAQAEERLVSHEVCPRLVAEVVSQWTGVPLSQLAREHSTRIADFSTDIRERIRGQDPALQVLERAVRASAAGLERGNAPAGVFLLVGPSGVGKTETALALAELLYGGERFLTTINMSEFQERHSVSRLIGSPPGYVGYGEGGMLTEAVRQRPYQVVLLDEVEKADPEVMNLFYQVFDKGIANDGEGREIDFRNTLILLTSNLGAEHIESLCAQDAAPSAAQLEAAVRPQLTRHFKPALLARMRVLPYRPLQGEILDELIRLKLSRFAERLARRQVDFDYDAELVAHLRAGCEQGEGGARVIDRLIDEQLQPLVVDRLLDAMAGGAPLSRLHASLDASGRVACEFA